MAPEAQEAKTSKKRVATTVRPLGAVTRRPLLGSGLLTVALLAMLTVAALPSVAATVSKAKPQVVAAPKVSPVTVTVPATTTPPAPISPPVAKPPPVTVTPPPTATPPARTPPPVTATPPATTPPVAVSPVTGVPAATPAAGSARSASAPRAPRTAAVSQQRLRSVVVRLSRCLSTLGPARRRMLLGRAGIGMAQPDDRGVVARRLGVSVAREPQVEQDALRGLETAARRRRCGRTPVWIHVPAGYRLVSFATVLVNRSQPAGTAPAAPAPAPASAITDGRASLVFTLTSANRVILSF